MARARILLCDDHAIFREGIKATLEVDSEIEIVAEAQNGEECIDILSELTVECVLLDINMPHMDGIECLKIIKDRFPAVKVIALTQFDEKRFVRQMLKFGADGYLLKSTTHAELTKAIETVLSGEQYLADQAYAKLNGIVKEADPNPLFPELSEREKQIIRLLSRGASTREIATDLSLSTHTVETHRGNIFKKLGVHNIAGLVHWAVNNGMD
ncbi:MAG: response regulator transcription factor [Cryomorphaceae bacterium]